MKTVFTPKAEEILGELRLRFSLPQHVLLEQVRDAAGFDARRTVDALAMGVWPSRGLRLLGFEIKVTRADWRRELREPAKAEAIAGYCDGWFVVAPRGVVPLDEVPPTWGLLELAPRGLVVAKEAPPLKPRLVDRSFLAALLRAALERGPNAKALEAADAAGFARAREHQGYELEKLQRTVAAFEEASGVSLAEAWNAGAIGAAVKLLAAPRGLSGVAEVLARLGVEAAALAGHVAEVEAELRRRP